MDYWWLIVLRTGDDDQLISLEVGWHNARRGGERVAGKWRIELRVGQMSGAVSVWCPQQHCPVTRVASNDSILRIHHSQLGTMVWSSSPPSSASSCSCWGAAPSPSSTSCGPTTGPGSRPWRLITWPRRGSLIPRPGNTGLQTVATVWQGNISHLRAESDIIVVVVSELTKMSWERRLWEISKLCLSLFQRKKQSRGRVCL